VPPRGLAQACNRTIFGGMNNNIDQSNFGYLTGQVNTQRQMQGEAYIRW
jgi:hypothetical protein